MLYYLVSFVSVLAGAMCLSKFDKKNEWLSLRMLGGFIAPIFFIYLGNTLLSIPISISAVSYFVFTITSVFIFSFFLYKRKLLRKSFIQLIHPSTLLLLLFFLFFLFRGFSSYEPLLWDEYSHWLTMPKQMYFIDHLVSLQFPFVRFVTYTPGWPIALIYPELVLKILWGVEWSAAPLIYTPLILGVISFSTIFDFIANTRKTPEWHALLPGVVILLILLMTVAPIIFETTVLIESPQACILIVIFLVFWISHEGLLQKKAIVPLLSILVCAGFLLKDSFSIVIVPIFTFLYIKKWLNLKNVFVLILPVLMAHLLWKFKTHDFAVVFSLVTTRSFLEIWSERSVIIWRMLSESTRLLQGYQLMLLPMFIFSFFVSKTYRLILGLIVIYGCCVFVGLYWLYMNSFGLYEALNLASFDRYLALPLRLVKIITLLMLLKYFYGLAESKLKSKKTMILAALLSCAVAFGMIFYRMEKTYTLNLNKRTRDPLVSEGEKLAEILEKRHLLLSDVYLIAQGSDRLEFFKGIYSSLFLKQVTFKLHDVVSWGKVAENMWMRESTDAKLISDFKKANVLWIVKADAWMSEVLLKVQDGNPCPGNFEKFFLVRSSAESAFECVLK
jgi:hypothetical protein